MKEDGLVNEIKDVKQSIRINGGYFIFKKRRLLLKEKN